MNKGPTGGRRGDDPVIISLYKMKIPMEYYNRAYGKWVESTVSEPGEYVYYRVRQSKE